MAAVLHLFTRPPDDLALATIRQHAEAGDQVTVVFLEGTDEPPAVPGVTVHRVPAELPYERLLERLFAVDHVVAW